MRGAHSWVAGCTGHLGVLLPWGVITVAAPRPLTSICDLGINFYKAHEIAHLILAINLLAVDMKTIQGPRAYPWTAVLDLEYALY